MTPAAALETLGWIARGLGGWYVLAGFLALSAWRSNVRIEQAVARMMSPGGPTLEDIRGWTILAVGALTLVSGLLLALLSPLAPYAFLANSAVQGAYLAWAYRTLPARDPDSKRSRAASTNAVLLYISVTLFVLGCRSAHLFG